MWRAASKVARRMADILWFGFAAIVLVIVMAGVLGRLAESDDLSSYVEG